MSETYLIQNNIQPMILEDQPMILEDQNNVTTILYTFWLQFAFVLIFPHILEIQIRNW